MLTPAAAVSPTRPTLDPSKVDLDIIKHAIKEAEIGFSEGVSSSISIRSRTDARSRTARGVPIGAVLYNTQTKTVLGVGRNRRVQSNSAIRHGETDCLENIGRLPANVLKRCTMYTTLSPCTMCAGAIILYGIPRVVMGENQTFVGGEGILRDHGVEIVNLDLPKCKSLMAKFIKEKPKVWWEDVGEEDDPTLIASTLSPSALGSE